jgi:hypothetical protein
MDCWLECFTGGLLEALAFTPHGWQLATTGQGFDNGPVHGLLQ